MVTPGRVTLSSSVFGSFVSFFGVNCLSFVMSVTFSISTAVLYAGGLVHAGSLNSWKLRLVPAIAAFSGLSCTV